MEPYCFETTPDSHRMQLDAARLCQIAGDVHSSQPPVGFGHAADAPVQSSVRLGCRTWPQAVCETFGVLQTLQRLLDTGF